MENKRERSKDDPFKIIPLTQYETDVSDFDFIREPLPRPPFRLLAIGSTMSGKTTTILNLISEFLIKDGKSIFDKIFVFTPTALSDPKYALFSDFEALNDRTYLTNELNMEIINYLINRPPDNENILVYLDDFGSSKKEMKDKIFQDLYFRGSHHSRLSTIFASQYYYSIPINIRTNASHLIVYPLSGAREHSLLKFELSNPTIHDEIFDEMLKQVHSEPHSFLYYELSNRKFHKNFDIKVFDAISEEEDGEGVKSVPIEDKKEEDKEDKKEEDKD